MAAGAALVDAARPVAGEAIATALTRRPRTSCVPPLGHTYDAKGEAPVRPAEQRRRDLAPATQRRASLEESRIRVRFPYDIARRMLAFRATRAQARATMPRSRLRGRETRATRSGALVVARTSQR